MRVRVFNLGIHLLLLMTLLGFGTQSLAAYPNPTIWQEIIKYSEKALENCKRNRLLHCPAFEKLVEHLNEDHNQCRNNSFAPILDVSDVESVKEFVDSLVTAAERASKTIDTSEMKAVYHLIACVEKNKKKWRMDCLAHESSRRDLFGPFECPTGLPLSLKKSPWQIEIAHACSRIYVSGGVGDTFVGEGSYKTVSRLYEYETWNDLVDGKHHDFTAPHRVAQNKKEMEVLMSIHMLEEGDRAGLVDTLFVNEKRLIQERYEADLTEVIEDPSLRISDRKQLLVQLTTGLMNLHEKLGISHEDIKPENALVRRVNGKWESVYTDFGFSFLPAEELSRPRLSKGTLPYASTEKVSKKWIGQSEEDKVKNAYQADVFSQGLVAYQLLKSQSKLVPWEKQCEPFSGFSKEYIECRDKELVQLRNELMRDDPKLSLWDRQLNHLISDAIQSDSTKRPTSKRFQESLDQILFAEVEEKLQTLPGVQLASRLTSDQKNLYLDSRPALFGPPKYLLEVAKNPRNGSIQLRVISKKPAAGLAALFGDKVTTEVMDANPLELKEVSDELQKMGLTAIRTTH